MQDTVGWGDRRARARSSPVTGYTSMGVLARIPAIAEALTLEA